MAIANLISQMGQQQPNYVGNFMQGYQTGEQMWQSRDQRERQNMLSQLGPLAAQGDQMAISQLAAIDPQTSMQYQDSATQQRQNRGEQVAKLVQMVDRASDDRKSQVYDYVRRYAIDKIGIDPQRMPEQYDPQYVETVKAQFGVGQQAKDQQKVFGNEKDLRKEFTSLSNPFIQVRDAYGRVVESAKKPSAAGDLAMIFNYMKMLDPGSVVREGEFATAENAQGVPGRIRSLYNRLNSGERLNPQTRRDFFERSSMLFERQKDTQEAIANRYRSLAERNQLNPENVVVDFGVDFGELPTFEEQKEDATLETLPRAEIHDVKQVKPAEQDIDALLEKYGG